MATITGTTANDSLIGTSSNDFMTGGDGNDTMVGGAGNDSIDGNNGVDWIEGGAGNDTLSGSSGQDHYVFREFGAANADVLQNFAPDWDDIQLDVASFTAIGANGRFTSGDQRFYAAADATGGNDANDRIVYNTSTGQLFYDADGSGSEAAQLIGTIQGAPVLRANDIVVFGTPSNPGTNGTEGNDSIVGTSGNDTINGLGGNDTIDGQAGNDVLNGGAGNDSLIGGAGADSISGGDGNDILDGTSVAPTGGEAREADTLDGGAGDDIYIVGPNDVIRSDPGGTNDYVFANETDWTLGDGLENLKLVASPRVDGQSGTGNELNNIIDARELDHAGILDGRGGNDTIYAGQHGGTIFGGDGNDVIHGETNANGVVMAGGAGNDTLVGGSSGDTFAFDVAPGAANADTMTSFQSAIDTLRLDGTVFIDSGPSGRFSATDDRFYAASDANGGNDSTDRVVYNTTSGQLFYDADGNGNGTAQLIATLQGAPALSATDIEVINGSQSGQSITGTAGNDSLTGGSGSDTINGGAGNDTLDGQGGSDSLIGGDGTDSLIGGDGNDTLDGGADLDTMAGGAGDDTYYVGNGGVITFSGHQLTEEPGAGVDTVISLDQDWTLGPNFENLVFRGGATAKGNDLNNVITNEAFGGNPDITINGMGGNDTLINHGSRVDFDFTGNYGNDVVQGAGGTDEIHAGSDSAIVVDMRAGTVTGGGPGGAGSISFTNVKGFSGGTFNDRFVANDSGGVRFFGNDGNDTLIGGGGQDLLNGGAGADTFIFNQAPSTASADQVIGFATGSDQIHLDATVMPSLGASGQFAADDPRFYAGPTAHDADDRVVYDTSTGTLYYDPDGNATAATAQPLGTFTNGPVSTINATDIFVDNGSAPPPPPPTAGKSITGTAGNDSLVGTAGNDTMSGLGGSDTMAGGAGNDSIDGNDGVDWLQGGTGNDTLVGSSGQDHFVFREFGSGNTDTMSTFGSGWDDIRLDSAGFTQIGATGQFTSNDPRFYANAGAASGHDLDDRIVFNTTTGQLFYDADGSNAGASQPVASVQPGATVTATDIWVT